tara:strand:+ start:1265 stop:2227 length:963 start_codon:yes stop_codon:yes gene_type:complete
MDVFGNSQMSLNNIGEAKAAQISKHRSLIEAKEKGVDMAKTVGETKLFMSAHGIQNSLKPLKPRIKKLLNRKAGEFKTAVKNKVTDYLDGDGGKARRLKEFKASQDKLNEDDSFEGTRKRFNKLSDEDKDDIRQNLKEDPEFSSKEDIGNLADEDQEAAQLKNTQLLKDAVSKGETANFVEKDAADTAAKSAAKSGAEDVEEGIAGKISNFAKSGAKTLADGVNNLNSDAVSTAKSAIKAEAKSMAKSTIKSEVGATVEEGAGEVAGAALDAIPFADIAGLFIGAGIAIKKARQVRKLEKQDEGLIATAPVVGSLQQVGV